MGKRHKIISAILALIMAVTCSMGIGSIVQADTCGGLEPEDVYQPSSEEVIQDPLLHWAIRSAMNSIKGDVKLTEDVVGDKSVKHITYDLCAHPEDFETEAWQGKQFWVGSLEGLQYAKSATLIDIAYTSAVEGKMLSDLSPLSNLTQLNELILKQDGINDVSALSNLVNLTWLDVSGNREITDISSVEKMMKLERLIVSHNKIQNVDKLKNLDKLTYLDISYNNISSLPDMSKLKSVYFLDASHNQITDVSTISGMTELQTLNLSGNDENMDIKPLVNLLKLDKDSTVLPDESKKEDLFAAIEVNKLFSLFNISKMTESDLTNVQNALDAYDKLTAEQQTYMDADRVTAARSNKIKVENGGVADYYPEYDMNGERRPIWNRIEIKVVDKKGVPIADTEFIKTSKNAYAETSKIVKTDSMGQLILTHTATDAMYDEIVITPAGDTYVSEPISISYSVNWGNVTNTVNGNLATGLEELIFTLIPKDEYVDKSELEAAIVEANAVEEAYKYTEDSYQNFITALNAAKAAHVDVDATNETVAQAVSNLKATIASLTKTDILAELKLVVKDENGNLFTRPFKFQIRVPVTGAEAWNQMSDAYTGTAYLNVSPGWADGKAWEVLACVEEPYDVDPFKVTIGVKNGKRYFKTVDGIAVDVDYEKEVIVKLRTNGAPDKNNERKPDSAVLEEYIEAAKLYQTGKYTPSSFSTLQTAITNAENVLVKINVTQNDYNAAAAAVKQAEAGLTELANKTELMKEINLQYSYSESYYTSASWAEYQNQLAAAQRVYEDGNATQEVVDETYAILVNARNNLVAKADKTMLGEKLETARALKAEDYQSGFDELLQVIADAQIVYDSETATQDQVNVQVIALEDVINALVKKPTEEDYSCEPGRFRAKVVDEAGNPLSGVSFKAWIGDNVDEEGIITSDSNGVICYYTYGPLQYGKNAYVRLADKRYTTEDEHYFTVNNNTYIASIATVDGQPFMDGICLTYTLKVGEGNEPEPVDKVMSDETTFRAKVVDEAGNLLDGIVFKAVPNDENATTYPITSKAGVLEQKINADDFTLVFTVALEEGQSAQDGSIWTCEGTHSYKTDGNYDVAPKITEINGKPLAEVGEITYILKKSGGVQPPAVVNKKELEDQIFFAGSYEGKTEDYTADSYAIFAAALESARIVYNNKDATQEQVDEAALNLKNARAGLVSMEKSAVCDKYAICIQVLNEEGNKIMESVPFVFSFDGYPRIQNSSNGVVEYDVSTADYGTSKIVVSLKDGNVTIGDREYTVEPTQHEFDIWSGSTDVCITLIDGETLDGEKEVKFVLKKKENIEPSLDTSALKEAMTVAEEVDSSKYTEESYTKVTAEMEKAHQLLNQENVSQEEINAQTEALNAAINSLVEKPAEPEPEPKPEKGIWMKDSVGWWYRNVDGTYPRSTWKNIEGSWYYFNTFGYRVTGWQAIDGAWYYMDKTTAIMAANTWVDGDRYYVTSNGAMVTGWLKLSEGWYYLNGSGAKVTGWAAINGAWYYMDKTTAIMAANAWVDGNRYYVTSSGAMATGWLKLSEGWYYLNGSGAKVTGWAAVNSTWYYMDKETGIMAANTWVDGDRYYVISNGAMAKGWIQVEGRWYYLKEDGAKATSQWIGNYYLKSDGIMAVSEWVDNNKYYVGPNGAWIPNAKK